MSAWLPIGLGFAVDALFGDPHTTAHPVAVVGRLVGKLEMWLRRLGRGPRTDRLAGLVLVGVAVTGGFTAAGWLVMAAGRLSIYGALAVSSGLIWASIAPRQLAVEAGRVESALAEGDIARARVLTGRLVGRDTATLSETELARAVVESVAENLVDGVVAPLFYAVIGGGALAFTYRIVNTLDSMFGYRSPEYRHFGWAAARLDDLVNFLPARLTPLLVAPAAWWLRQSGRLAVATAILYGRHHPSPNSGLAEAAFAGALGVRLGGASRYKDHIEARPAIGTGGVARRAHIGLSVKLMTVSSRLAALAAMGVLVVVGR